MKHNLTVFMLLSFLAASLAACGDAADTNISTSDAVTTETEIHETTADPYVEQKAVFDALPALDFGGDEFVFAAQANIGSSEKEIYVEEADGDIINDAIYKRNLAVNERFNCEIRVLGCDVLKTIRQAVSAGDDSYSIAMPNLFDAATLSQEGYLLDYQDFDVIDLSAKWWDQGTAEMKIGGHVFFMSGDINILDNDVTYILLFNKKLIADNDMEEPYQLVRDSKWTLDVFAEMCKNISADINGDAMMDEKDRYGYVTTLAGPNTFFYGSNLKYIEFDADYTPYLQVDATKVTQVLEKVVNVTGKEHQVSYLLSDPNVGMPMFMEDRVLFYGEVLGYVIGLRGMESEFGVLPIPKFDEAQEGYTTYCESNSSIAVIPNAGDSEKAATILEAMAIQSHIIVTPAYYDVALARKYARDEESVEMLDIALANRVYDMGRFFSLNISDIFQDLAAKGSTDFASRFAKVEKGANKKLNKIIEKLENIE